MSAGLSSAPAELVGLYPGSVAFHRVWWHHRQPRSVLLHSHVPWCARDGEEIRQSSERRCKQPPSSLLGSHPLLNGILSGRPQREAERRGCFASSWGGGLAAGRLGWGEDRTEEYLGDQSVWKRQRLLVGSCVGGSHHSGDPRAGGNLRGR